MLADSSLLLQMQLALIGIVLVTGLFYLWRSICRIEDKVTRLAVKINNNGNFCPCPMPGQGMGMEQCHMPGPISGAVSVSSHSKDDFRVNPVNFADANLQAQEIMKEVFGEDDDVLSVKIPNTTVIVEEQAKKNDASAQVDQEVVSEADTETANPLSKNKLNKMTPEDLKNLCLQRGLFGEGSKKVLVDRLLGITRD